MIHPGFSHHVHITVLSCELGFHSILVRFIHTHSYSVTTILPIPISVSCCFSTVLPPALYRMGTRLRGITPPSSARPQTYTLSAFFSAPPISPSAPSAPLSLLSPYFTQRRPPDRSILSLDKRPTSRLPDFPFFSLSSL